MKKLFIKVPLTFICNQRCAVKICLIKLRQDSQVAPIIVFRKILYFPSTEANLLSINLDGTGDFPVLPLLSGSLMKIFYPTNS